MWTRTCQEHYYPSDRSLLIVWAVGWFIVMALILDLSVKHRHHPKSHQICLYLVMAWVIISYSLSISSFVRYGCREPFSLAALIINIIRTGFQAANTYMVFGAAFFQIQQLATLYTPPLGASNPFKRSIDYAIVLIGLVATVIEWTFFGLDNYEYVVGRTSTDISSKFGTRGFTIAVFNFAWHCISLLNLLGSGLSIRGSKGQNKLAFATMVSISIFIGMYYTLGKIDGLVDDNLMLLVLREPALLISLFSLLIISRKTPVVETTVSPSKETSEAA